MRLSELHPVGTRIEIGTHVFTADEIVRFATQFDPQHFHIDEEAARHSLFGGLCASGWHTAASWMRLYVTHWNAEVKELLGKGETPPRLGPSPGFAKLSWLRPVFAGDSITYFATLLSSRDLASRPGRIVNTTLCEGVNQDGKPVVRFEAAVLEFA